MQNIQFNVGGRDLTFAVRFEYDHDQGAPWENSDGHGPVSGWESRDKRPGEMILNTDRGSKRFYDFAEACLIARRDGWDAAPYNDGTETKRQQAAKAALSDFEYLRAWCNDEWRYVGAIVTLLDDDGNETTVSDSLWGLETFGDYHQIEAKRMAEEMACALGVSIDWPEGMEDETPEVCDQCNAELEPGQIGKCDDCQSTEPTPALRAFTHGRWHAWQGTAKVMLSDESEKRLREFDSVNDAVNWLFTNDEKDAARALTAHIKGV